MRVRSLLIRYNLTIVIPELWTIKSENVRMGGIFLMAW